MGGMVERVAQAIEDVMHRGDDIPDVIRYARAAIEAMREPTSEMCQRGIRARADGWGAERIANAWKAMIDEAGGRRRD